MLNDRQPGTAPVYQRKELVTRLLRDQCELCGSTENISVHHVRKLADLATPGDPPRWAALMATKRRKTLVVCADCHDAVHAQLPTTPTTQ